SSTVSGNSATGTDPAPSGYGGGIFFGDTASSLQMTNSTVSGNSASGDGGGVANEGNATIDTSTVSGNSAVYGGGIYNGDTAATLHMTNSTVSGNSASAAAVAPDGPGGGIFNTGSSG